LPVQFIIIFYNFYCLIFFELLKDISKRNNCFIFFPYYSFITAACFYLWLTMEAVIQVLRLSKQYKKITAVDALSFNVSEGDVYGFLGQNGAGKSTTIRMLLTLVQPTSGEIGLFGLKIKSYRK